MVLVLDSYLALFFGSIDSFIFIPHQITDFPFTTCTVWSHHWSPLFIWSHAFFPCTVGIFFFFLFILLAFDHWSDLLSYLGLCYHLYFTPFDVQILVNYYFFPLILYIFGLCYHLYFIPSDAQILVNYYFSPLICKYHLQKCVSWFILIITFNYVLAGGILAWLILLYSSSVHCYCINLCTMWSTCWSPWVIWSYASYYCAVDIVFIALSIECIIDLIWYIVSLFHLYVHSPMFNLCFS